MTMPNGSQTVQKLTALANRDHTTVLVAIAIGPLCLLICAILGWYISVSEEKSITLLIELAGMVCGAFLGFLASPKAPGEQATFLTFAKAISAFLSGYALSKIDRLIDSLFQNDIYKDRLMVARLLIFVVAMIVSFMIAYSYRAYLQKTPAQDDANKEPPKTASKYPADKLQG
jgi:O-antigen/teichoic acid export membrane protein